MNQISRFYQRTLDIFSVFGYILILLITLIIFLDISLRYFFNLPIRWTTEITEYTLVWLTFGLAAWAQRRGAHVSMDFVVGKLKSKARHLLELITTSISAVACFILTWYAGNIVWQDLEAGYRDYTHMAPPLGIVKLIIPIGLLLLSIELSRSTFHYWRNWRTSSSKEKAMKS